MTHIFTLYLTYNIFLCERSSSHMIYDTSQLSQCMSPMFDTLYINSSNQYISTLLCISYIRYFLHGWFKSTYPNAPVGLLHQHLICIWFKLTWTHAHLHLQHPTSTMLVNQVIMPQCSRISCPMLHNPQSNKSYGCLDT